MVSSLLTSPFPVKSNNDSPQTSTHLYDQIIQATFDHLHAISSISEYQPASSYNYTVTRQFYLGPPLSGAPFHAHGPAYNSLL